MLEESEVRKVCGKGLRIGVGTKAFVVGTRLRGFRALLWSLCVGRRRGIDLSRFVRKLACFLVRGLYSRLYFRPAGSVCEVSVGFLMALRCCCCFAACTCFFKRFCLLFSSATCFFASLSVACVSVKRRFFSARHSFQMEKARSMMMLRVCSTCSLTALRMILICVSVGGDSSTAHLYANTTS